MANLEEARRVAEQNLAYRKGVVLGLTMAEVGILIIFVLLLLIGFNEWSNDVEREARAAGTTFTKERAQALEAAERLVNAIKQGLRLPPEASVEEIRTMVQAALDDAGTSPEGSALREAREVVATLQGVKQQLAANGYPPTLLEQLEKQGFAIANQQGQLRRYEDQLRESGLGTGERPCWVREDGTIEFLFDVVLQSDGIRMRENILPLRARERSLLPIPSTRPDEVLSQGQFLQRTAALYQSSLAQNCRFFVTVYDSTGPTEKNLYKAVLKTVEGHFYKRLANATAPF